MKGISLDYSHSGITKDDICAMQDKFEIAHKKLHTNAQNENKMAGWLHLPSEDMQKSLNREIMNTAQDIRSKCDVFVVVGIGGSYLGAKATIEALSSALNHSRLSHPNETQSADVSQSPSIPEIYFAGNGLSGKSMHELLQKIQGKDICLNVISKSGTTTEPAIAFRILKQYMEDKYGKSEAKNRIFVTTDKANGALRQLADTKGYKSFIIPANIGGRYSVLTPVGLLPIAVAGIDIDKLISGAKTAYDDFLSPHLESNICYQYAALRHILYEKGKKNEILVTYEPSLSWLAEWWKQLYGESDGKEGRGIFPSSALFSADLHSMGQYIQQGERHLFETVLFIDNSEFDIIIPHDEDGIDGLDYLEGKSMNYVNHKAFKATVMAHEDGGVPNIIIHLDKQDEYNYGALLYFFEKSCAIGGYVANIDPFNQPGVEKYKKNMFKLLGKPVSKA